MIECMMMKRSPVVLKYWIFVMITLLVLHNFNALGWLFYPTSVSISLFKFPTKKIINYVIRKITEQLRTLFHKNLEFNIINHPSTILHTFWKLSHILFDAKDLNQYHLIDLKIFLLNETFFRNIRKHLLYQFKLDWLDFQSVSFRLLK